jgi:hypothetical protein
MTMRSHFLKEATSGKTIFVLTGLVYSGKRADDRKIEKIEKKYNKILPDAKDKLDYWESYRTVYWLPWSMVEELVTCASFPTTVCGFTCLCRLEQRKKNSESSL